MSSPQYPYGQPHEGGQQPPQPPADPFQPGGYPPSYPDSTYAAGGYPVDPAYQAPGQGAYQAPGQGQPAAGGYGAGSGYQPTQPYPAAPGYDSQPYAAAPGYPAQPGYPPAQGYPAQPPYQGGGYPGYPSTPPRSRTGLIVGVVAALLVLVVGGGIGAAYLVNGSGKSPDTPVGLPSGAGSADPSGGATGGGSGKIHSGDLRKYLVDKPSSADKCSTEEGTDESLSLDQASQLSADADSQDARKKELERYEYKIGAVRCWVTKDDVVVDIRLYQFGSTDGAKGFFDSDIDGTSSSYDSSNTTDVSGVPGAKSFADPKEDDDGYVSVISIGLQGDTVLVVALAEPSPLDVGAADDLLRQEYAKL